MINFIDTFHCQSHVHCLTCRNDAVWRARVGAPDVCPLGIPLGATLEQLPEPAKAAAPKPLCIYRHDTSEQVNSQRPCAGTWIKCGNKLNPVGEKIASKYCNETKCTFYKATA